MRYHLACRSLALGYLIICATLYCMASEPALTSGIDRSTFDASVAPGDDFFQYVNGEWIKNNPIPAEYSRWGAFPKLRDDNLAALKAILESLSQAGEPLSEERRKLRDFYRTAMDEALAARQGITPLKQEFERIAKISSSNELIAAIGGLRVIGVGAPFGFSISQDKKQSTRYAVHLDQGGMGLPDRDYYVGSSKDSERIRGEYHGHVTKMFRLLGDSAEVAAASADTVLRIETKLAEAARSPVELRDREANYNRKSREELVALAPNLDWNAYFSEFDIPDVSLAIVGQPEFFARVNELLASESFGNWQTYLRWHLLHAMAPYLSTEYVEEDFRFYGHQLRGAAEIQPRWKRVITAIDSTMGEALGKIYVERHFPPAAKRRMDDMVVNLTAAYRERIESRDWMGPKTKKLAHAKLDTILPKIGYPDKWRDYSDLEVKTDSYAANMLRAEAFNMRYRVSKLGQPVDRLEWHMTPPTVNAYYNASKNEIVFPAGILQPPFFNLAADDAVNYGAIGAVIGHEISHGFDDQGSRSDAHGNLVNWWADDDRERFTQLTDRLVDQYNACTVLDGLHVNGRLTLGENIADLGGVAIARAAYLKSLAGKEPPEIDGFTGEQRFFIGFAQVWRGSMRDAELRLMIRTNPHAPGQFRTVIPLSNIDAFYEAFDVRPGQKMYRPSAERVEVW